MNKQTNRKLLTAITSFLVIVGLFYTSTYHCYAADENSSGTSVTFTKTEVEKYLLSVRVEGNGSIYDGKETIRGQISKYSLEVGDYKIFQIVPDTGYNLQYVMLNGIDITEKVYDGKITILGTEYEQELVFYFNEIGDSVNDNQNEDPNHTNKDSSIVQTGDIARTGYLTLGLITSCAVIIIVMRKKSKNR